MPRTVAPPLRVQTGPHDSPANSFPGADRHLALVTAALLAAGAALVVAVVAVVVLAVVARRAVRALAAGQEELRQLRRAAEAELRTVGRDAGERLDRAVDRAEAAVAAAETAARIADAALTAPVVKARAWGAGTAAATRTFRERRALRAGSD